MLGRSREGLQEALLADHMQERQQSSVLPQLDHLREDQVRAIDVLCMGNSAVTSSAKESAQFKRGAVFHIGHGCRRPVYTQLQLGTMSPVAQQDGCARRKGLSFAAGVSKQDGAFYCCSTPTNQPVWVLHLVQDFKC
jgi:hypothetical protein